MNGKFNPTHNQLISPAMHPLSGTIRIPGDKSISHRAVMLGAIAKGTTRIQGFLSGADCLSTIECFQKMGIHIEYTDSHGSHSGDSFSPELLVHGQGLHGLKQPDGPLYTGNSGTTTRLISGILAGQDFSCILTGDDSLNRRPMNRIIEPLSQMGASIKSISGNGCAPLGISPGKLHGIRYNSKVASAQVKSAVLLAGLYADSPTEVTEPALSRNHTESMLSGFGADVSSRQKEDGSWCASVHPCRELFAQDIQVPGDISSAAYFIAAALLVPGSRLLIKNAGINPTRAGILKICREMGADITCINQHVSAGEPTADLLVNYSPLHGTAIGGSDIPTLIDELPIIAVLAAYAKGTTVISDAAELKVKESNRIDSITRGLQAMGADVIPTDDGMIIHGGKALRGAAIDSFLDHRIAMAFTVAALAAEGETIIQNAQCVDVSYPGFYDEICSLGRNTF